MVSIASSQEKNDKKMQFWKFGNIPIFVFNKLSNQVFSVCVFICKWVSLYKLDFVNNYLSPSKNKFQNIVRLKYQLDKKGAVISCYEVHFLKY